MKTRTLIFMCMILPVLLTTHAKAQDYISLMLKPRMQTLCGLNKLDPSERERLNQVFHVLISNHKSDLYESAMAYLSNEGWEEVEVLGTRSLKFDGDLFEREYLFVEKSPRVYILEPRGYSAIAPGVYLGQMSHSSCEIIDQNGDVKGFLTKDTR